MPGREPSWWYGDGAGGWTPRLLAPLGTLYGAFAARRMRASPLYRAPIPVIAIGNFTSGGTGKTPCVRVIAEALRRLGHTPVVLSRGYGGSRRGPHWVDAASDTSDQIGDEPLLLAVGMPVLVARDRVAGAKAIATARPPGGQRATVILMDDGLQNPSLAKDLTIAVIDAVRGFGNGRCIPAGPLRAPLADQLWRVDALVLNAGNGRRPRAAAVDALTAPISGFRGPILTATITPSEGVAWQRDLPVIAYAGIGVPERFFDTLTASGAHIQHRIVYADHYAYTDHDAERLLNLAATTRATLITTEKDLARLRGRHGPLEALRSASRALPITLQLDANSATTLSRWLELRLPHV